MTMQRESVDILTAKLSLPPKGVLLAYSSVMALIAGFVNAVTLFFLAVPVGNLTGITTQLGMDRAHPWLYESRVLAAILIGFLIGAAVSGAVLRNDDMTGPRHALVLTFEATLLVVAAVSLHASGVRSAGASVGVDQATMQAMFAAIALGLQNGLTSSFREMSVRTTHFTGTVTDLGLMLGRSPWRGLDKWKFATLALTLLLFLSGGIAGIAVGARIGGLSLLIPAAGCAVVAVANLMTNLRRRNDDAVVPATG
jgi:uncharacterized membrane protein YoaK (UPF0700 family)